MELDIKTNIANDSVIFKNYDFVKQQVLEFVEKYNNVIVSEEAVDNAKKDRAQLNKIAKALNDKRIAVEKQFKEQFEPFKQQVNELIEPIKIASENIDKQIKKFEELEAQEKFNSIKEYFQSIIGDLEGLISFEMIYSDKWTNKGFTIDNIKELIDQIIKHIQTDLEILDKEKRSTYLTDYYLSNKFDLSLTLQEKARIEEREKQLKELEEKKVKEQQEQMQKLAEQFNQKSVEEKYISEEKTEEVKENKETKLYNFTFQIMDATEEQVRAIGRCFKENNINYKKL